MTLRTPNSPKRILCYRAPMYPGMSDSPTMIVRDDASRSPFTDITQTDDGYLVDNYAGNQMGIKFDLDGKPIDPAMQYWLE